MDSAEIARPTALLLTGRPGVGKTTVIRRVVAELSPHCGGFYTEEIRAFGQREGFRLVTLDGESGVLAHAGFRGTPRVSRYGVDLAVLKTLAVPSIELAVANRDFVVIDEIGTMELFSPEFRTAVRRAIDSGQPIIGTITMQSHPFADEIKRHPNVEVIQVTEGNRDELPELLHKKLKGRYSET